MAKNGLKMLTKTGQVLEQIRLTDSFATSPGVDFIKSCAWRKA